MAIAYTVSIIIQVDVELDQRITNISILNCCQCFLVLVVHRERLLYKHWIAHMNICNRLTIDVFICNS